MAKIVTLTAEEDDFLLWLHGDYFEAVSGNLSFTNIDNSPSAHGALATAGRNSLFIFDAIDSNYGSREWSMRIGGDIPNGPAIVIFYRRGDEGHPWGIISLVNRAWTHVIPLDHYYLAQEALRKRPFFDRLLSSGQGKANRWHSLKVARLFMHRLAKAADQYWDGGRASIGKL
jgi:hypothetical protein